MSKVSLRMYNREIENLIDGGQIEEAIAHCTYILQSYPKHIETYRLLGKAFLESKRYGEAADIFSRVLASIPDDFVSQVAMSIIREDEGNISEAIWHMERAYEVQPANHALQDELRRLIGRRDSTEPDKIRLTRGALARMYAKGNLYQQAISETRAMLAEEPARLDLQVLLAQLCFQAGKRIEATELSSTLLSKFPYCYEANFILSKILPETTRADDARIYEQRIAAMDPYTAYLDKRHTTLEDIPDNTVMIDRLDYIPGSSTQTTQPEWAASLGLDLQSASSEINDEILPGWLVGMDESAETAVSPSSVDENVEPDSEVQDETLIPDWMRSAGWEKHDGTSEIPEEEQASLSEEPEPETMEVEPAELPEWLKEMAPDATSMAESPEEISTDLPDWISKLEDEEAPDEDVFSDIGEGIMPDWLKEINELPGEPEDETTPDQSDLTEEELTAVEDSGLPEWLADLKAPEPEQMVQAEEPVSSLDEHLDETEPAADEPQAETEPVSSYVEQSAEMESSAEPYAETELVSSRDDQMVESISGADSEADTESVSESPEGLPEWLIGLEYIPEPSAEPISEEASSTEVNTKFLDEESSEVSKPISPSSTSILPADELEDLQDVSLDSDVSKPSSPVLTSILPAEELEDLQDVPLDSDVSKPSSPVLTSILPAEELEDLQDVPLDSDVPKPSSPVLTSILPAEELEDLQDVPLDSDVSKPSSPVLTSILPAEELEDSQLSSSDLEDQDASFAWLENLAAKQGADEDTLFVKPEERRETPPDWVLESDLESTSQTEISVESTKEETTSTVSDEFASSDQHTGQMPDFTGPRPGTTMPLSPDDELDQPYYTNISEEPLRVEAEGEKTQQEETGTDLEDADAAFAWLENLAAKQGAEEETLFIRPEDRVETPPDWVRQGSVGEIDELQAITSETEDEVEPVSEDESPEVIEKQPVEELPEWLQGFDETEPAEAEASTEEISSSWLENVPESSAEKALDEGITAARTENLVENAPQPAALSETSGLEPVEDQQSEAFNEPHKLLLDSQNAIRNGKIELAVEGYSHLVEEGLFLEETIHDLRDALDRFPIDLMIWQTLGDAYMKSNRLQDALEAFAKAEDLIR